MYACSMRMLMGGEKIWLSELPIAQIDIKTVEWNMLVFGCIVLYWWYIFLKNKDSPVERLKGSINTFTFKFFEKYHLWC
jgi:hypothetical protein